MLEVINMSKKIILNKNELLHLYNTMPIYGRTSNLVKHFSVSEKTIRRNLKEYNIQIAPLEDRIDNDKLIEAFKKHGSYLQASKEIGISEPCARKRLKDMGYISKKEQYGALKNKLDVNIFKDIDTQEKAYWLGFFAADGCVYESSKSLYFQINLSLDDIDHLRKLKEFLNTTYEVTQKNRVCTLQFSSKRFCENLIANSITPRKTKTYKMPTLRKDLVRHFIRGYFDGDGCISYKEDRNEFSFQLITASKDFLEQTKKLLPFKTNITIHGDKKYPNSKYYYLRIGNKNEIEKAFDYLYKDATIYLERKYEIFSIIKSCPRLRKRSTEQKPRQYCFK